MNSPASWKTELRWSAARSAGCKEERDRLAEKLPTRVPPQVLDGPALAEIARLVVDRARDEGVVLTGVDELPPALVVDFLCRASPTPLDDESVGHTLVRLSLSTSRRFVRTWVSRRSWCGRRAGLDLSMLAACTPAGSDYPGSVPWDSGMGASQRTPRHLYGAQLPTRAGGLRPRWSPL